MEAERIAILRVISLIYHHHIMLVAHTLDLCFGLMLI